MKCAAAVDDRLGTLASMIKHTEHYCFIGFHAQHMTFILIDHVGVNDLFSSSQLEL